MLEILCPNRMSLSQKVQPQEKGMLRPGFEPGSSARKMIIETIEYSKVRENFIKWMKENYSGNYTRSVIYHLDRYFRHKIRNQMEILEILK